MSFYFTSLPMSQWTCGVPLDAKSLEESRKFFAVQFSAWIYLKFGGWTCPIHPMLIENVDNVLSSFGWSGNGNMKVWTGINNVTELKGLPSGICPIHSIHVNSVVEIQQGLRGGRPLSDALALTTWNKRRISIPGQLGRHLLDIRQSEEL